MLPNKNKSPKTIISSVSTIVLCCMLGMILIFEFSPSNNGINGTELLEKADSVEETTEDTTIKVYITGEVKKPDVYALSQDARLQDLIKTAGGLTDKAYTENLNFAQKLEDGSKVVILNINEISGNEHSNTDTYEGPGDAKININTADEETLAKLDAISDKIAKNIVTYRNDYGNFTSIEEIKEVDGIGDVLFKKIKNKITVD